MPAKEYPTITAGRTLLNCSPAQFEQFHDPERFIPRVGLIEDLATLLGYEVSKEDGRFFMRDKEGVCFAEAEPSRRAAFNVWWTKVGLAEATKRRAAEHAWEDFPRQGRRISSEDVARRRQHQERSIARDAMYGRLESIWNRCRAVLLEHSPQTEVWMHWARDRSLPRRHQINRIGERRALTQALRDLYDLDNLNRVIGALLDGKVHTDTAIGEALQSEMPQMACDGEIAGLLPRYALLIAVNLSPHPALQVFEDLKAVLTEHDVADREQLAEICVQVLT